MSNVPAARIELIYEGVDISREIQDDLLSFTYNDNESGKADDIAIRLKDDRGLWRGDWFPAKGDKIRARIIHSTGTLDCGQFEIDDIVCSGPPKIFEIRGVSVPLNPSLRRDPRDRVWEDAELSTIASEIAGEGGISLIYDVASDPRYDRIDQREESNLAFLHRLCEENSLNLKITDSRLVVFDQSVYEQRGSELTYVEGRDNILGYSFRTQAFDLYKSCTAAYYDPETEELIEVTFEDETIQRGQQFTIRNRMGSFAEAERVARAELRRRNRNETTCYFQTVGDTRHYAGMVISLQSYGAFNGNYLIESVTHRVENGYTLENKLRQVLRGGY